MDGFLDAGGIYVAEENIVQFKRGKVKEDDWVIVIYLHRDI